MTCAVEKRESRLVASGGLNNVCSLVDLGPLLSASSAATSPAPVIADLEGHEGYLSTCAFVESGDRVVTGSGDSTCILWDVARAARIAQFKDHTGDVMSVAVSPSDRNIFISGSCDAAAKAWDTRTGKCVTTFEAHEGDVNAVRFMRHGTTFGTGSDDSAAKVFDMRARTVVNSMQNENVTCAITCIDFSASGRLLFAGYDNASCFAWDALVEHAPSPTFSLSSHTGRVSCLGVSSQGHAVATGSWDGRLAIWV